MQMALDSTGFRSRAPPFALGLPHPAARAWLRQGDKKIRYINNLAVSAELN
jgi:hypothetical protein